MSDRDYYKNKVQRLNHQISYLLSNRSNLPTGEGESAAPSPIVDIEALIAENKYLHERITQLQIENELIKRNLSKYKVGPFMQHLISYYDKNEINYVMNFFSIYL